jgi:hypothetical protein
MSIETQAKNIRVARHTLLKRLRAHMQMVKSFEADMRRQKYRMARAYLIHAGYLQP